jgi:TolB-like protein
MTENVTLSGMDWTHMDPEIKYSDDDIKLQLKRILASSEFDATERNRKFLSYIVERTLNRGTDAINAYTIATEVFRRDYNFNPQLDAIVRVEARRLRRSLRNYYLSAGRYDLVRIYIPTGTYIPSFSLRENSVSISRLFDKYKLYLKIGPFVVETSQAVNYDMGSFLVRQLIRKFMPVTGASVINSKHNLCSIHEDTYDSIFILSGGIAVENDGLIIDALLMKNDTGQFIWANQYNYSYSANILNTLREVADKIFDAIIS